jgi:Fur family ferric uptake transcriptional regulator
LQKYRNKCYATGMNSAGERFRQLLKSNDRSVTTARMAVFEALLGQEPLNMHELVTRVPAIDRASVYRAIELFERLGVVQRLHTGWKYKLELSDKFTEHHHHVTCVRCDTTTAINEDELEQLLTRLTASYDFTPIAHQLEIQGLCSRCRRQSTANAAR